MVCQRFIKLVGIEAFLKLNMFWLSQKNYITFEGGFYVFFRFFSFFGERRQIKKKKKKQM